jgi:endo-1,4-beta-xylanase
LCRSSLVYLLLVGSVGAVAGSGQTGSDASPKTLRAAADKHHLLMGAAVDSKSLASDPTYASILQTEYSVLEPDNELKFDQVHPQPDTYDFSGPDSLVAFAQAHNLKVRGHNLLWYQSVPDWIKSSANSWTPATLSKIVHEHIAHVVGHYKGKLYAWDVVNEPFNENGSMRTSVWYNAPGIGFSGQGTRTIEQALRWAHEGDPNAKLFVNEYGADVINPKSDAVYAMAKDFVQRGVPLSGIGFELHINPWFVDPAALDSMAKNLKRLADLGLEVQFTEVDVRLPNPTFQNLTGQADAYRDLMNVCLQQPACTLFQTWGFTDLHSWIPEAYPGYGWALPFDTHYKRKPAYRALFKKLETRGYDSPRPPAAR